MLEGIPGPLVSSAKGTKALSMTLTSWYASCIHGASVSWFPLSLKGSQTHWNQGWKRPIAPGHLVHPLTLDTTGFSVLCSPEGFVLSALKCLKSRGFHHSHWETIPQLDTYSLTNIFLRAHPNFSSLHFISWPSSWKSFCSRLYWYENFMFMWMSIYGFIISIIINDLGGASGCRGTSFSTRCLASPSKSWPVTETSGFQEGGLHGTGVVSKRSRTKKTTVLLPSSPSKALWPERA